MSLIGRIIRLADGIPYDSEKVSKQQYSVFYSRKDEISWLSHKSKNHCILPDVVIIEGKMALKNGYYGHEAVLGALYKRVRACEGIAIWADVKERATEKQETSFGGLPLAFFEAFAQYSISNAVVG